MAAGREDLAVPFLNAYLEKTGDWEGAQLLPLYLCRQAYVRAKVNSLLQEEDEITPAERQAGQQAARDYFRADLRLRQPASPANGNITIVCGISGVRKKHRSAAAWQEDAGDSHPARMLCGAPGWACRWISGGKVSSIRRGKLASGILRDSRYSEILRRGEGFHIVARTPSTTAGHCGAGSYEILQPQQHRAWSNPLPCARWMRCAQRASLCKGSVSDWTAASLDLNSCWSSRRSTNLRKEVSSGRWTLRNHRRSHPYKTSAARFPARMDVSALRLRQSQFPTRAANSAVRSGPFSRP